MSAAIDPVTLSRMLGQEHRPTEQQAAVIGAPPGPMLVVAGAGAGKTETMAARVVWLVANGHVRPEEVLGLTFTRKAARELGQRIRRRLGQLAASRDFRAAADPAVLDALAAIAPEVSTYDAYAGELVRAHGLLLPAEPAAEILDEATRWAMAREVVRDRAGLDSRRGVDALTAALLALADDIDGHLADPAEVRAQTGAFLHLVAQTPPSARQKADPHSKLVAVLAAQRDRLELLPLVEELHRRIDAAGARTFGRQMALAARLAREVPEVREVERRRHRVVMLDEYQDTSHAQRVLLRSLHAGSAVTAVGDPMQAIYGWRGATATNLAGFPEDFRAPGAPPAPTLQLTTSWRNPPEVLAAANLVADRAFAGRRRTVDPLTARPGAPAGRLDLALHADVDAELAWVAARMAEEAAAARAAGRPLSAAVLVRRNADCAAVAGALAAAGVAAEIRGVGGLLELPEVVELVCHLRVLADPADDEAMLRLLAGPRWRLGAKDITALARRARQLAGYAAPRDRGGDAGADAAAGEDPLARLGADLDALVAEAGAPATGLGHAVADPALGDGLYSAAGAARIAELGERLGRLRRWSLRKPLPDLLADVEEEFGLRVEVAAAGGAGPVHLDRLADVAADYARRAGADLAGFLGHLERAAAHDRGLEPGRVRVTGDRVEILTVHKAKGLEWEVVAVPHVCATVYDRVRLESWLTRPEKLLPELTGDAAGEDAGGEDGPGLLDGTPVLDAAGAADQGQLVKAIEGHKADLRAVLAAESERLFYVALTRAGRRLLVSGCQRLGRGRKTPDGPSAQLLALARAFPEAVGPWAGEPGPDPLPLPDAAGLPWPPEPAAAAGDPARRPREAAELVRAALADPAAAPAPIDRDITRVWADEVTLLLDERARAAAEVVEVPLPARLSTSEVQAMLADPGAFARRRARPVPYRPNRFARRGTAFHAWLEHRLGAPAMIDEEELAALAGVPVAADAPLAELKETFLAGEWADRVPEYVEVPFDIGIGGRRVVGRIDAVFRIGGRWAVVDWKTGRRPTGEAARLAALQLAVYRLAWADRRRAAGERIDPGDVRAMFHYVAEGVTVEPDRLPDRIELATSLRAPRPGAAGGADGAGPEERVDGG